MLLRFAAPGAVCQSSPEGWIDCWRHNALSLFDSEAIAWSVVPTALQADFDMYAYAIFSVLYVGGEPTVLHLPATPMTEGAVEPLPKQFRMLGYDAVSVEDRGRQMDLCHAPLSCNGMAAEISVNRYCLLDELDTADDLARRFSFEASGVEPGPYAVVEVYRKVLQAPS